MYKQGYPLWNEIGGGYVRTVHSKIGGIIHFLLKLSSEASVRFPEKNCIEKLDFEQIRIIDCSESRGVRYPIFI